MTLSELLEGKDLEQQRLITDVWYLAAEAERERCKAAVLYSQCRNGYHTDSHGARIGHYNVRMFEWIDSGHDPRLDLDKPVGCARGERHWPTMPAHLREPPRTYVTFDTLIEPRHTTREKIARAVAAARSKR